MIGAIQKAPNKIKLPYPHPGQQHVLSHARRHNYLSAGRRWRKTTLGMAIAMQDAIAGKQVLWGAPTYNQVRVAWKESKRAAGGTFTFTQQRMTAEGPQGGIIYYRSLDDPDNVRGLSADAVIIDEAAYVKQDAWYGVLRPMLVDSGGGSWMLGTPKGRNWFWREFMAAGDRTDAVAWQVPTLGCAVIDGELYRVPHDLENPDISFDEIRFSFETMPEMTFRQEILAEFLEAEGSVFRNLNACLNAPDTQPYEHRGHRLVMGVDWGKQQDFTAISVGCVDCKQEVALDRFRQIDYVVQRARLVALAQKWLVSLIVPEENAMGVPIIELLQRDEDLHGTAIKAFNTTAASKPPLIENMAVAFERAEWQFLPDRVARGELEGYERSVSAVTGRPRYGAPQGLHDDTVIARALMLHAAGGQSGPLPTVETEPSRWDVGSTLVDWGDGGSRWKYD